MIKKLIVLSIMFAILCTMANAKMPQKGDNVRILIGEGLTVVVVEGFVTDIGNGLICLNSTYAKAGDSFLWTEPTNICTGAGSITVLRWLDKDGVPI
jgi:hypothetical protein